MKKILFLLILSNLCAFSYSEDIVSVNNYKISRADVEKRMNINYFNKTLQDIIDESLILQEAKKNNIKVEDKEIAERLNSIISNFKNKSDFNKTLSSINLTEKQYKEMLKDQILIEKTVIAIKKIEITDEDVKKFYDSNKEKFNSPQSLKLRQIVVKTKQEADDLYIALVAGANFEKLAEIKSIDENLRKNKGDIGYISKNMLSPEIQKEISPLKQGEFTKPIMIGDLYTILKVEEIRPDRILTLDEVKFNLKDNLLNQLINQKKIELINELRAKSKIEYLIGSTEKP
jgi:parvulin-like peptidyl-prolyl isomerase